MHSTLRHQYRYQAARTWDFHPHGQLSMNVTASVRSAGGRGDFTNQACEPLPAQLPRTRRTLPIAVVALMGDAQESATSLYGCPGIDETVDPRVHPLGRHVPPQQATSRSISRSRALARAT